MKFIFIAIIVFVVVCIGIALVVQLRGHDKAGIKAEAVDAQKYFVDKRIATFAEHIQAGDLVQVKAAIASGIDVNAEGLKGFRPIFFIFPAETADVARELLTAGADPNVKLADGTPPLLFAVRLANSEFTKALLDHRADPNSKRPDGQPVLHEAVMSEAPQNIRLLVDAGADINAIWGDGTPLYRAINAWCLESAIELLDRGADTEWRKPTGRAQMTAGESFCSDMPQRQSTEMNREPIRRLFEAFERRGVRLSCAADIERFK